MAEPHVTANRRYWDAESAEYQAEHSHDLMDRALAWGTWRVPEADVGALGDVAGRDVLEYGCGGAQWSIALAATGARVVGLDLSGAQLRHAQALVAATGAPVPLVQASAEKAPFAPASFDVVFSDHGAMTFCDPARTVPEAARLLRPGGRLAWCCTSPLKIACSDTDWEVTEALQRPWFAGRRLDDGRSVEWNLPHGEWIALLGRHGFGVEALYELQAPAGGSTTYPWFSSQRWASRWPAEDLWVAVRR